MPRRRAGQADGSRIKQRVRTGCNTCRSRRVKCDENKPRCHNCSQRGLSCDNSVELKWEEDFEGRGLAFGRQGRWSKYQKPQSAAWHSTAELVMEQCSLPLIRSHHFINSGYSDFGDLSGGNRDCGDAVGVEGTSEDSGNSQALAPPLAATLHAYSNITDIDSYLLDYYLMRLCPLTTSSRVTPSPFAQLVIPLFSIPGQDDILRAVLALSARHRAIDDPQWSRSAMTLKGRVITSLRRRLLDVRPHDFAWDPQILVIVMFLCLYEILDNCDHRWVIHLRASKEIIQQSRQRLCKVGVHHSKSLGGLTTFTERFFAFQDVISRTACGNSALFGSEYWADSSQPSHIDTWMGCSPDLVSILCRIAELSRLKAGDDISFNVLETESADLEQRLEAMQLHNGASPDDSALVLAAELKRKSVLLYHHCVLYNACPSTPFVRSLVKDILKGVWGLIETGFAAGLAFPVFVAAVELHPTDEQLFHDQRTGEFLCGRKIVLETLAVMAKSSLSNISRTTAVIQKVWRMRDRALEEDYQSQYRGPDVNDWSIFVGPYSSNISLS